MRSSQVAKAIMAPAVVGAASRRQQAIETPRRVALLDGASARCATRFGRCAREIEAHTDDVGTKFAEVARAMHAGDEPERAIRGQATSAEVEALLEEGVGVLPMPAAPDELN